MKVIIIHPHLFIKGGGERLTKILTVGLEKLGVDVCIVTSSLEGGFLNSYDFEAKLFPKFHGSSHALRSLATLAFSIKEAIDDFVPDAVVSMTEDTVTLGISKLLKRRLKTIQYTHFPYEEEAAGLCGTYIEYYRFPSWFNKFFLWSANIIACNSKYTQVAIRRAWGRVARVVYPAIDYIFETEPSNLGSPRENILLCAGRFSKLKRQDFLVRVFPKIKEEVKDSRLVLAGYYDERHASFLKDLLNQGNKDIEFRINPTDQELIELYSLAKVYCHPRIGEHFGLAPLEAMSQGAPVVAYNSGGIRETMVNGKTGYLVGNDEEFVNRIIHLLKVDNSRWQDMQICSVERSHQFTPDRFVEEFISLLAG